MFSSQHLSIEELNFFTWTVHLGTESSKSARGGTLQTQTQIVPLTMSQSLMGALFDVHMSATMRVAIEAHHLQYPAQPACGADPFIPDQRFWSISYQFASYLPSVFLEARFSR
jgi:hypothetical protein